MIGSNRGGVPSLMFATAESVALLGYVAWCYRSKVGSASGIVKRLEVDSILPHSRGKVGCNLYCFDEGTFGSIAR